MNYKNKYLKYKKKYLELKNNLNGGADLKYIISNIYSFTDMSILIKEKYPSTINFNINKECPHIIKKKFIQKFGNVSNEFRSSNPKKLINPPIELIDYYNWLRDDKRENKEILKCIQDENNYTDSLIEPCNQIKNEIYQEIKNYIVEDYYTYKYKCGDESNYKYFEHYLSNKDYPQYCRISIDTNKIEILLDVNELAIGKQQCDVSTFTSDPSHKYISYGVDYNGSEKYQIIIYDLVNKNYIEHPIPLLAHCNYFWIDSVNIYYIQSDEKNNPYKLYLYNLKTNTNTLIYEETNKELQISANKTTNNKYVILYSGNYDSNQAFVINFKQDPFEYTLFKPLVDNIKYYLQYHNNYWYIQTNDNAVNWKISRCHVNNINNYEDFIPYNENIFISDCISFQNYIVYKSIFNGSIYINIINPNNKILKVINLIENKITNIKTYYSDKANSNKVLMDVYGIDFGINLTYDTDILNITFSTPISPMKYFDLNMNTLESTQVYEKLVPGYVESEYKCENIWVPQAGTRLGIPLTLIYKKDLFVKDGSMPLYLYGYGSYGICIENTFDYKILPLLDRGFIYAVAHIRGGSELGYNWYLDGKMYNKLNTFDDFIRCTEFMIQQNYTRSKQIVIEGRSAGGLLIGATITKKPDLYKIAVLGVPFVDVLNTMSDSTIPLTIEEWTQWGNPNELDDFNYIRQYCPYTNIKKLDYPHMFISGGLHDPRVPYWEPMKFLAKIREYKTDSNIQVLRMETEQGHFGGSSRYKSIEELAELYTFIFDIFV
jgi:oligopeptidase B